MAQRSFAFKSTPHKLLYALLPLSESLEEEGDPQINFPFVKFRLI